MSLEKHDLSTEFPQYKDTIHQLKLSDHHFARLFREYQEVDQEVVRLEQNVEVCSDEYLETRKKLRLQLKDSLYQSLRQAAD
jgi:uncharacterized protein YdcH (DUF465 family)